MSTILSPFSVFAALRPYLDLFSIRGANYVFTFSRPIFNFCGSLLCTLRIFYLGEMEVIFPNGNLLTISLCWLFFSLMIEFSLNYFSAVT